VQECRTRIDIRFLQEPIEAVVGPASPEQDWISKMLRFSRIRTAFRAAARLRNHTLRTIFVFSIAFVMLLHPMSGAPADGTLEELVRQWLGLRKEIGSARNEWKEQKALLEEELLMLERQGEQLGQEVAAERRNLEKAEDERNGAVAERDGHRALLDRWAPSLARAEEHLRSMQKAVPSFMGRGLLDAFRGIQSGEGNDAPALLAQRLHDVFNLYSQLEQLNSAVHADKVILRDGDGREREMDVLFSGLAIGFAVSRDNRAAAFGRLTPEGVIWEWDARLAEPVRHAWACFHKERNAVFVELPLQIGEASP
jgi:hypothetical protein